MSKAPKVKVNRSKSGVDGESPLPSPRKTTNLKKFEDLLLTVEDVGSGLGKEENISSARVQLREDIDNSPSKKAKRASSNSQPKTGSLLRRRSRNLAKLSLHSVSESSDRMAYSIQKRSEVAEQGGYSPRNFEEENESKDANNSSQKSSRSMSAMSRLGFKNIFNSPGTKREKPEKTVLGKEIYGSVIVEDALVHTNVRKYRNENKQKKFLYFYFVGNLICKGFYSIYNCT